MKPVSNPPNPWLSTHVEYLDEPPPDARLEIYEEEAKSILSENDSPDLGFRYSVNPYRGCFHACAYCLDGDTPILMADRHHRSLRELRVGDEIIGTRVEAGYRRFGPTRVLAHWSSTRPACRLSLDDGTAIIASADHRFLTERGWVALGELTVTDALRGERSVLRVRAVEALGVELPMFDITTGTGDFIASGVVAHNCYARPSHQYLGYGAGTDFDRKIVAKVNAPALLRAAFDRPSWKGDVLMFSGITDCYQPIEASYGLTRACLEVCAEYRNPVAMITKSMVIRRDLDLLARLAKEARATVSISIPFAHDEVARKIEPYTSPPSRRFETLRLLADAGVATCVAIAPVIPGLNDTDIPEILERAHAAGARHSFMTLLRLPAEVLPVFRERIREQLPPERVKKIEHAVVELRGGTGRMNDASFGARFRGVGERWKAIEAMYELHRRRLGYDDGERDWQEEAPTFRRPPGPQLTLF